MKKQLISVGIDIGTTTTQMIFSKIGIEVERGFGSAPKAQICEKSILHQSEVYFTPIEEETNLLKVDEIKRLIQKEYEKAGVSEKDIATGAVIITGESAKRQNAKATLKALSQFSGEFVVATAGPDLEGIIAGKGAGAMELSKEGMITVANLDIGGGTTNIAVFSFGEVEETACYNIGGRCIRFLGDKTISYLSQTAKTIIAQYGFEIKLGKIAKETELEKLAEKLADVLYSVLEGETLDGFLTEGSSKLKNERAIHSLTFSGGVADCMYTEKDLYCYHDFGVFLAKAITKNPLYHKYHVINARQTIRATVIGAGVHSMSLSGSTITCSEERLPLVNLPVLTVEQWIEKECYRGNPQNLIEKVKWFIRQNDTEKIAIAIEGRKNGSYEEIGNLARCIAIATKELRQKKNPLVVIVACDIGKILGILLQKEGNDEVICIDGIEMKKNDYIDIGKPPEKGLAVPVVIKTLIF